MKEAKKITLPESASKQDKKVTINGEVSDEVMEQVAGGFREWTGPAAGWIVECPFCGNREEATLYMSYYPGDDFAEYDCQRPNCRGVFYVDAAGYYYW